MTHVQQETARPHLRLRRVLGASPASLTRTPSRGTVTDSNTQ